MLLSSSSTIVFIILSSSFSIITSPSLFFFFLYLLLSSLSTLCIHSSSKLFHQTFFNLFHFCLHFFNLLHFLLFPNLSILFLLPISFIFLISIVRHQPF